MTRFFAKLGLAALLSLAATAATAECYADYKAKRDDPLRLHYGVIALPDTQCASAKIAAPAIAARIAVGGWTLLSVVSIFDADGLTEQRKTSAGEYYLRY